VSVETIIQSRRNLIKCQRWVKGVGLALPESLPLFPPERKCPRPGKRSQCAGVPARLPRSICRVRAPLECLTR